MKIKISITALFLTLSIILHCCLLSGCSTDNELKILSADGGKLATVTEISESLEELSGNDYRAYLEIVLSEAAQIIKKTENCNMKQANKKLLNGAYTVHTVFDRGKYESVKKAYEQKNEGLSFGCAITDLNGKLLAVFSSDNKKDEYINYAIKPTPPYSSFKPLSVYTPAIEKFNVYWSSQYMDTPVKKVTDSNGKKKDWPANATGIYSEKNTTVATAIKESLNTIAVKCLMDIGVKNSFDFLKEKFKLTLDYEEKKAETHGADEVLGNVALGYLNKGISPVDMAGYYQIFANGGYYYRPYTIQKICDKQGKVIYEYESKENQVIKPSTAFIMNQLLQGVTTAGGTGVNANIKGVPVGGKTGTGDYGNWFAGFTPSYSCAVWHGTELPSNCSTEIFSSILSDFDNKNIKFPICPSVKKAAFCCESGKLFSSKCKKVDLGYYDANCTPAICDQH